MLVHSGDTGRRESALAQLAGECHRPPPLLDDDTDPGGATHPHHLARSGQQPRQIVRDRRGRLDPE
jgi:hypothetical protein